eukprot:379669-Pelagomonas_calceolata.AAC.2
MQAASSITECVASYAVFMYIACAAFEVPACDADKQNKGASLLIRIGAAAVHAVRLLIPGGSCKLSSGMHNASALEQVSGATSGAFSVLWQQRNLKLLGAPHCFASFCVKNLLTYC